MKKFIGFCFMMFVASVITGIIVTLAFEPETESEFDYILMAFLYPVMAYVYWRFYGKNQWARFRQRRAQEIEQGLEITPIIKKKNIIRLCVMVGVFIVSGIISKITGISTENTWLGGISVTIMFCPMVAMLYDKAKELKISEKYQHIAPVFYFAAVAGAVGAVISIILSVLDAFGVISF